jgi:hypothetical protein
LRLRLDVRLMCLAVDIYVDLRFSLLGWLRGRGQVECRGNVGRGEIVCRRRQVY